MNKWKKRILIIIIALLLNLLGRFVSYKTNCPAYLNICGTIMSAYFEGPVVGAVAAVLSCAVSSIFIRTDWYILVADIVVAVAVGLIAKRNRFFDRFGLIVSATAFFAMVRTPVLLIINLSVNGGRTGLMIADGIVDYLNRLDSPLWLQYTTAALFVCFADSLASMLTIFLALDIHRTYKKRKKAKMLKQALGGKIALGLALALGLSTLMIPSHSQAEDNTVSFVEKVYNSENGLVGGCVNDVTMTKDGQMWIGTYGGLYRFNGSKFVLIDNIKAVRSIQTLYVDNDDRLWAGTQDSGLTLLNIDMTYVTLDMDTGLPSNSVKCISRDSNGYYYFGTTAGLVYAEYADGNVNIISIDEEAGNIRDLSPSSDGRMVVMSNLGEISSYESGERVAKLNLGSVTPTGINHDGGDRLFVGTDSGTILVYEYYNNSFHVKKNVVTEGLKTIRDFYFDDNGITYITGDNGIGYLDKNDHLTIIESGGFNNSIEHIFKDYQGNLWFTSSRCGLLSLGRSSFTDVFKLCNVKSSVTNAVISWNNRLYVGTNDGLRILDPSVGESFNDESTEFLDGVRIRCMDKDIDGDLLVATYEKGLIEISSAGKTKAYINPEETGKKLRVVKVLNDGTIISSSDAGMVFMKDHRVKHKLILGEDMKGGTVLNILETETGELLCGTDGDGIAVIKDGKLDRYISRESGLPSGVVLRICPDKKTDGYFVLTGSGLCYLDSEYTIREFNMPYYNNFDIATNLTGEVFVFGGAGIYVSNYDSLMKDGGMLSYTLLDSKAGLPGSITSNAWNYVTNFGYAYICGTGGVYLLDLNNYEMKVDDFRTKITNIKRDGVYEDVTQFGAIEIPRGSSRVELGLEINNYTTADPMVSYYLSGVDHEKTFVRSSKLENVSYYNIPYGKHDFVIDVLDEKGRVLSEQIYVISKDRELYETIGFNLYFYIFLFTFLAFVVVSIVQGALWSQNRKETDKHEQVVAQLEREKTEALERALHMEEDANRTKSEFLANMSHEIRTPINAIIGMDTMIMRESGEANIRNYAKDIHSAGRTLLTLINDILDFSKIESGKLELVLGEYALSTLINDVVNMIEPKARAKKLKFEVNVNPEIPNGLYGDEVRIEQIMINILNNAVKYTDTGSISFGVDYEEEGGTGSVLLKVRISDTGIGIKAEDIEKLFSRYERIDEQRNKKIEGTGLGMSITKNLLDKMGSSLEVDSTYGVGSTFSFVLSQQVRSREKIGDYKERAERRDVVLSDTERYHAPDAKVLVVDDVEMNLIVAGNLLKRVQVQVVTAQSGKEALALCEENQYDIILLDSMMPEMNGEETMQAIRKECPLNAETPIIVLTAHAVKGAREEYMRLGYTNYLSKPLDGSKLEAMLQSYLPDEKIILVDEDTDAPKAAEEVSGVSTEIKLISEIEGIDAASGIETSGGADAYGVICRNFRDTAGMRIDMIRESYEKEEWDNYTIQVHALKSSARLIGAYKLSEKAQELETAGREGEIDKIKANTESIIKEYEWFYDRLNEIFENSGKAEADDRPEIDREELKENLSEMRELLEAFDFDTAKELFDTFEDYRMPAEFKATYEKMKGKMAELDRDGVLELIDGGNVNA